MIRQATICGDASTLKRAADRLGARKVAAGPRAFAIAPDLEQYAAAIDNGAVAALHKAGFVICAAGAAVPAAAPGEAVMVHPGEELEDVITACCEVCQ